MKPNIEPLNFLHIDELRLDKEWLGQAELYKAYADRATQAQFDRDLAKNDLDLCFSEVCDSIRSDHGKFGLEKVTESAVKETAIRQKAYIETQKQLLEAEYRLGIFRNAVTALEHRKRALTMLVSLHESNYFADPKVTAGRATRDAMDSKQQARVAKKTQIVRELGREED